MKTVVVLGIQRSATSLVAKGLHHSGDVWWGAAENQHFDNYEIYRINNEILREAGGSEWDPPSRESILIAGDKFLSDISNYVKNAEGQARAHGKPFWGWKISNTGWTVDLWHPYLKEPHYVWTHRPPAVVARRLVDYGMLQGRCSGWSRQDTLDYAQTLVREHNRRILEFLSEIQR